MESSAGQKFQSISIVKLDPIEKEEQKDNMNDIIVYYLNEDENMEVNQVQIPNDIQPIESNFKVKKRLMRSDYTCNFCKYASPRKDLLRRHIKSHSNDRPHICNICERGFKTTISLKNHINWHSGVKPHLCTYCNKSFTTSGELTRHVRYKHTHEKPHKCTECDYASVELYKLRRHKRCHTGERPYQCPHCTYASPDSFKLKRHLRTHTGETPYKCDDCSKCFTQSNSLKTHKIIHNYAAKPVYACELCPGTYGRKIDLRVHVQTLHTSDKPLKCERCDKSFPDRYSYKIHKKIHKGEKFFKCDLCPYATTTLRYLRVHILKHTDEKPFTCDQCDQSFRQKQQLRRHTNLYHNPNYVPTSPKEKTHQCQKCKRQFVRKGNLIRHVALHEPDSKHQEETKALKLARQKGIKQFASNLEPNVLRSGYQAYVEKTEEVDSEDQNVNIEMFSISDNDSETVSISDGNNQQFVVLDLIQLENGSDQQFVIVRSENYLVLSHDVVAEIEPQ